jgi:hypothetical protein
MEANEVNWNEVKAIQDRRTMTRREHARGFEWDNQPQEERGAVRELIKSLSAAGEMNLSEPWSFKPDPPDCVAECDDGTKVAFEAREFVSEEAIRLSKKKGGVWIPKWSDDEFLSIVTGILYKKDAKRFNGGPYSRIILVIYTAETNITPEMVERLLAVNRFDRPLNITDVYLIMEPRTIGLPSPGRVVMPLYPFFKMRFQDAPSVRDQV